MTKTRNIIPILLCSIVLNVGFLTGCSVEDDDFLEEPSIKNTQSSTEHANASEKEKMTDSEKELMKRISFDKQAVEDEILEDWQRDILEEIRFGNTYLKEKYPDENIDIVSCETATSVMKYNNYTLIPKDNPEESYELHITASKNGSYIVEDNYYNKVIKGVVQDRLSNIIMDAGLPCIKVKASFGAFLGIEHGEEISVNDILTGRLPIDGTYQIYLDASQMTDGLYENVIKTVKNTLSDKEIVGYFTVIIGSEDSTKSVYRESFSLG